MESKKSVLPNGVAWLLWPLIISLPLSLTAGDRYSSVFKQEWYSPEHREAGAWPHPLGLCLGILAVIIGQIFTIAYHWLHVKYEVFGPVVGVQAAGPEPHAFWSSALEHLSQPEGFVMLGGYLAITWMCDLMPASYYRFDGGICWGQVAAQLLIQDAVQFLMHLGEHKVDSLLGTQMWFYRRSHKPHHRFTNPKLFDAFNGSAADTFCMILVPLVVTSRLVHCNVWTYMTFGSLYANWLCLIHSEVSHPWDAVLFRRLGLGTASDHHVHHTLFTWNYGHLFTYCDRLWGTYKHPGELRKFSKIE